MTSHSIVITSQWTDNCDAITRIVISNSLDIDFIHGNIHGLSCKKTPYTQRKCQIYRKISNISHTKSLKFKQVFLVASCCCLCPDHWSQVLGREWRCSWGSAGWNLGDKQYYCLLSCSYIRGLMVHSLAVLQRQVFFQVMGDFAQGNTGKIFIFHSSPYHCSLFWNIFK